MEERTGGSRSVSWICHAFVAASRNRLGGGTGYGIFTYYALCFTATGPRVVCEGLEQYILVDRSIKRCVVVESEFKGIENGFVQIVRLLQPFMGEETRKPILLAKGELRFHGTLADTPFKAKCQMDERAALTLVEILATGVELPAENLELWAGNLLRQQSPQFSHLVEQYLKAASAQRAEELQLLRAETKKQPHY